MASRVYYMTLGVNLEAAAGTNWQVAGIKIDNPSGSWLLIRGIDKYVPPYTNQWAYPLVPSQSAVTVEFTDSPSGSVSALVGSAPVVTLYDAPLAAYQGIPSGSGGRVTTIPPSLTQFIALFANLPAVVVPSVALTATQPLVIRKLAGTWDLRDLGAAGAGYDPRSVVSFYWEAKLTASWAWQQAISQETPYVSEEFSDGALEIPSGGALEVTAIVQLSGQEIVLGVSATQCMALVEYYSEVDV